MQQFQLSYRDSCTSMKLNVLGSVIMRYWNQYVSAMGWINKSWYVHTVECQLLNVMRKHMCTDMNRCP